MLTTSRSDGNSVDLMKSVNTFMQKRESLKNNSEAQKQDGIASFKFSSKTTEEHFLVNSSSTASLINDLTHLYEQKHEQSNVVFELVNKDNSFSYIKANHTVLMARSNWFLCSYGAFVDSGKTRFDSFEIENLEEDYFNRVFMTVVDSTSENFVFRLNNVQVSRFREFMKFIYTAELNLSKDNLVDLLQLADLFQVLSLKDELIKYLLENLEVFDVEKLIKIFYLSDNLKNEKLKERCIHLINKRDRLVVHSLQWKELLAIKPTLVLSVFKSRNV